MQATGRMAGHASPTQLQAIVTLLAAAALVVGLGFAAQRMSIGSAQPAPAPDSVAVQQALNAHRLAEKGALAPVAASGGVTFGPSSINRPVYVPFDATGFRLGEKAPLAVAPTKVVQVIPGEYRPISTPEKADAIRRGTIAHR